MALFDDLVTEVYTKTNRPHLVDETNSAVKQATMYWHTVEFFPKDLFEVGIDFTTEGYLKSLAYRTVIPRYRQLKYIRKSDATGAQGTRLNVITPTSSKDLYGNELTNVCYLAGENINIRSSTLLRYIIFGCYIYPNIVEANYSSWIATEFFHLIAWTAAANVLADVGRDSEANSLLRKCEGFRPALLAHAVAEGY